MYEGLSLVVFPIRVDGNGVLTAGNMTSELVSILVDSGFSHVNTHEEKTEQGHTKVCSLYQKGDVFAFTSLTPCGNNICYNDRKHRDHVCAGYVSLVGHADKSLTDKLRFVKEKYEDGHNIPK